jgi:hypothetical protein
LLVPVAVSAALVAGLVDEQANSTNPRVYDFRGAIGFVRAHSQTGDVLIYGPSFLENELLYYRPGLPTQPIGAPPSEAIHAAGRVFVLGSFLNQPATAGRIGTALAHLQQSHRKLVRKIHFPNVTVWEFR